MNRILTAALCILVAFAVFKVYRASTDPALKNPCPGYVSGLTLENLYSGVFVNHEGAEDYSFIFPPVWYGYFKLINATGHGNTVHLILNACLTLVIIITIGRLLHLRRLQGVLFAAFMVLGIYGSYLVNLQQGNMSLFEMAFVWLGLTAFVKRRMPWAALFFFLAGSMKIYLWIFGALFIFEHQRRALRIYLSMIAGYIALNAIISPAGVVHLMGLIAQESGRSYPLGFLSVPLKVVWLGCASLLLLLYACVHKNHARTLLLFTLIVYAISPRTQIYQHFFVAPAVFYLAMNEGRTAGMLLLVILCVSGAWNYYAFTGLMWFLAVYMFYRETKYRWIKPKWMKED